MNPSSFIFLPVLSKKMNSKNLCKIRSFIERKETHQDVFWFLLLYLFISFKSNKKLSYYFFVFVFLVRFNFTTCYYSILISNFCALRRFIQNPGKGYYGKSSNAHEILVSTTKSKAFPPNFHPSQIKMNLRTAK